MVSSWSITIFTFCVTGQSRAGFGKLAHHLEVRARLRYTFHNCRLEGLFYPDNLSYLCFFVGIKIRLYVYSYIGPKRKKTFVELIV